MSSISAELEDKAVLAALKTLGKTMGVEIPKALQDVAYEGLRLSQMEVPHDEGTLQNSGAVEPVGDDIVLGYHTKYAARLHEHPEYRFQKGRKGKYLEDPLLRNQDVLGLSFGKNLQTRLF